MKEIQKSLDQLLIDSSTDKLKTDLIEKQVLKIIAGAPTNIDAVKKDID
jgi:hypothetical protein